MYINMNVKTRNKIFFYILVSLLVIIWLMPMLFIVLTSLKSNSEFFGNEVFTLPKTINWRNFPDALVKGNLARYMLNSLIITGIKLPIGIILESVTAFALTRLFLKRANAIFVFFLIGMMIPMQVTLMPLNIALTKLSLTNTYLGLILIYIGFGLPFGILVMRGFFRSIPIEVDESARLFGCNNLQLLFYILIPMAKPAIATLVILDFLSTWNEFLFSSLLITKSSMRTVPAGLFNFFGEFGTDYTLLSAGVLISVVPILLVYIFFQRYFVEGMSGAVKG